MNIGSVLRSKRRFIVALGLAAAFVAPDRLGAGPAANRQDGPAVGDAAKAGPDAVKGARELEAIRTQQRPSAETAAQLRREIAAIGEDRRKLTEALITSATRLRTIEDRVSAAQARLAGLETQEAGLRKSLEARRGVIVEILAALQRIGRRPPPALLVSPESALQSVRTAMLLGAILPEMRGEAEKLSADLSELVALRQKMSAERDDLTRDYAGLSAERQRTELLIEERQRKLAETQSALDAEQRRAIALAHQADNLKDLIAKLEREVASAARAADAARAAEAKAAGTSDARPNLAALKDPGRLTPAIAFASAKGILPLPVNGVRIRDFGASDGLGGIEKGLWIASRTDAQVTAPCDGWVVYAGPFRSYGQLLILNAGGGYHVLLAGMERISVELGQFVLTGEPVAVMGGGPQSAAAVAIGSTQPVLYVEFRKDGTPVDPSPWWATTDSEKVRG